MGINTFDGSNVLTDDINRLRDRVNKLQYRLDNICNDEEILSAVADKILKSGVLNK
jgi:hypothetical protein